MLRARAYVMCALVLSLPVLSDGAPKKPPKTPPPPAKPEPPKAEEGPSYDATVAWLAKTVTAQAGYVIDKPDSKSRITVPEFAVRDCQVEWTEVRESKDDDIEHESRTTNTFDARSIAAESISFAPRLQNRSEVTLGAKGGAKAIKQRYVHVTKTVNKTRVEEEQVSAVALRFPIDSPYGPRVVNAFKRLVVLCEQRKEPF